MTLLKDPVSSSGENLDNLLRAFFQAEMPNPWPALEVPSRIVLTVPDREEDPPPRLGGSLFRSRFALAASIALLVAGPLLLSGVFRDSNTKPSTPVQTEPVNASRDNQLSTPRYRLKESLQVTPKGVETFRLDIYIEGEPLSK